MTRTLNTYIVIFRYQLEGEIVIILAKKYFLCFLFCILLLIFSPLPFVAKESVHTHPVHNPIGLCEIFVADTKAPLYFDSYSTLKKTLKGQYVVLIHQSGLESGAGYANSISIEQNAYQTDLLIVVNGTNKVFVSHSTSWQTDLSQLIGNNMIRGKWKLNVYLSSKLSQESKPIVDFSVCNMEKIKFFNGSFILWMAELQAIGLGKNGWVVTKKLVEKKIKDLPPAQTVGCVLPDQFSLPKLSGGKKLSIISVIYASDLSVQAVKQEFVTM